MNKALRSIAVSVADVRARVSALEVTEDPNYFPGALYVEGPLGVGTQNPDMQVHIAGGGLLIEASATYDASSSKGLELRYRTDGGGDYGEILSFDRPGATAKPLKLYASGFQWFIGTTQKHVFASNGRVGIGVGAAAPNFDLEVIGNLHAAGHYVVQNNTDGTSARGIFMWTVSDTNWGIYMASSGAGKSLADGTACAGDAFTAHAIRIRFNNNATQGFILENSAEACLMSVRGDGHSYIYGNLNMGNYSKTASTEIRLRAYDGYGTWYSAREYNDNYGFRWGYNGATNQFQLYRHDNSETGVELVRIYRTTHRIAIGGNLPNPDGTLHVHTDSAGAVTASGSADDFVIEGAGTTGMSILSPDDNWAVIYFGSPSDSVGAVMQWQRTANQMEIGTHSASAPVIIKSGNWVEAIRIDGGQWVGIGVTVPAGKLHVKQAGTGANAPPLVLEQADLSDEFIEFKSTVGSGYPIELAAPGTLYAKVRVSINGTLKYLAVYN